MRFNATVYQSGKTATGIRVPDDVVEAFGSGKRPAVRVTVGAHSYRTTLAPMGGEFWIPLSAENREKAGVAAGDDVVVDIELDTEPRELEIPPDFSAALSQDQVARSFFEGLSYSNKRWHVLSIEGAKTDDTRKRRIDKSVAMLREGRAR